MNVKNIVQLLLEKVTDYNNRFVNTSIHLASNHSVSTLHPGMLFDVIVEHHACNGLCVTFLGGAYRGAIESSHLDNKEACYFQE